MPQQLSAQEIIILRGSRILPKYLLRVALSGFGSLEVACGALGAGTIPQYNIIVLAFPGVRNIEGELTFA